MSLQLMWRASSYSGVNGDCVQVAHIPFFYKSSYSGQHQDCVDIAYLPSSFRKSSYSGQGVDCVEVADLRSGAAVRDSKHPDAGHLAFPAAEWDAFLTAARVGEL
ncbi:DUF397 domain-containing protein [Salinactinospora qingdaonensis]|uniref:DUF397 domain-containing protein n=1 Tax=Salinactinospora qingdaonensis TaxID=702744 RepID=A0ABP7G5X7_9ACTN